MNPNDTDKVHKWLKNTVSDLFMDFLCYDREKDKDGLSPEKFRELMVKGTISKELMLTVFKEQINIEYRNIENTIIPPISKEHFIMLINSVEKEYKNSNEFCNKISKCFPESTPVSFAIPSPCADSILAYLNEIFNNNSLIEFYCFEMDFGQESWRYGKESIKNSEMLYKELIKDLNK